MSRPKIRWPALAGLSVALLLGGCAQSQAPDTYASRPSTELDAQKQARGRTTSQLQLGFGEGSQRQSATTADQAVIQARQSHELAEPKTFLGTVPCTHGDTQCQPMRLTLTTAPSQQWRMRVEPLSGNATSGSESTMGCWHIVGTDPTRFILETPQQTVLAEFIALNKKQLKLVSFNQTRPTLETLLSVQADVDPINSVDPQTTLHCTSEPAL